ncbi:MAG: tyrosine-type recombinase/integrase [Candidatus Aminicenantales bacterium]|jgi:integrase
MKKERNLKLTDGKWNLDFTFRGKRVRQFGGYTKDQARNTLVKIKAELLDVARGFKKPDVQDVSFEKFADDFLELYSKPNKRSWTRDEFSLNNLKAFFKGDMLRAIGAEKIERYKANRKAEVSPASCNRELACLKTLFNKAVDWGRLGINPAAKVKKLKENNTRERILNPAEASRLIECAGPELRPILIIALNTGMRKSEILSLRWQDVDFVRGFILIGDSKSGKSRKLPMNTAVFEALKGLQRRSDYVFFNPKTETHIKGVTRLFAAALKAAEISGVRLHDLRHTAATKMVEAGVDLVTVSKILGHSSIQMTMRYAHPTPENMRLAVNRLGEILDSTRQIVDRPSDACLEPIPITPSKLSH